jgi:hypothetical protein
MKGITVSRSCSVILLDTASFINMLSISVTPTAYISESRLEQAIRPDEHTGLKGLCQNNVVNLCHGHSVRYISDSRLEQAIRPDEHTGLKGQCHDNVVDLCHSHRVEYISDSRLEQAICPEE